MKIITVIERREQILTSRWKVDLHYIQFNPKLEYHIVIWYFKLYFGTSFEKEIWQPSEKTLINQSLMFISKR